MAASSALKAVGEPAVSGLIALLADPDDSLRASAARLMGEIPVDDPALADAAIRGLLPLLSDPVSLVRWTATGTLASIARRHKEAGSIAVPALIALLDDDDIPHPSLDKANCEQAAAALEAIGTDAAKAAVNAWWHGSDEGEE
jgi:HEAT repeat protein